MNEKIELVVTARDRDLGGFTVRRLLPYATHRMVGPFIFFDHMGPADLPSGKGMDVRPHPHIGLATVTYLFEGQIFHRDSLGSEQVIEPGAINWMTAGRGIVHSERSPANFRKTGGRVNGIQCWVALPTEFEETEPSFKHHPASTLPEFEIQNIHCKLLLGKAFGKQSPVRLHSDLFYLEVKMPKGSRFSWPEDPRETALYLVEGNVLIENQNIEPQSMVILKSGAGAEIQAQADSRMMILGGHPVGPRLIWWNLVSSSSEKLEEAKRDWILGPRSDSPRFQKIPGDDLEFIPAPENTPIPKGSIM
ncbi:MAG: pirin family protein [Pseudobdellovibrionaceae bacterium]